VRGEEVRVLGAFVFYQLILWIPACLLHYWGEPFQVSSTRIEVPGWLRKIFGDFRQHGSLEVQAMMIQGVMYFVTLGAIVAALISDLTRQRALLLWLVQLFLTVLAVGIGRVMSSRSYQ
jgi:hypothetical protein